jgi:hypothetical protein
MGIKVIHHPTGHVEVQHDGPEAAMQNMHGHPGVVQPAPQPGVNSSGEGMSPDPMAAGMNAAMGQALASASPQAKEPIQKTDQVRGGNESPDSKKKPDASVGKKPAPTKGPATKAKADNGKAPKATSVSKQK